MRHPPGRPFGQLSGYGGRSAGGVTSGKVAVAPDGYRCLLEKAYTSTHKRPIIHEHHTLAVIPVSQSHGKVGVKVVPQELSSASVTYRAHDGRVILARLGIKSGE